MTTEPKPSAEALTVPALLQAIAEAENDSGKLHLAAEGLISLTGWIGRRARELSASAPANPLTTPSDLVFGPPETLEEMRAKLGPIASAPAISSQEQATGDAVRDESAWLIECAQGLSEPYFAGVRETHNGMGFCWFPKFTGDHMKAIRFSRKEDAEAVAEQIKTYVPSGLTAVEHRWIATKAALSADKASGEVGR